MKIGRLLVLGILAAAVSASASDIPPEARRGVELIRQRIGGRGEIREVVKDPETGMTVVRVMMRAGSMMVPLAAYVSPDGRYVLFGSVFDAQTGRDLTREVHLRDLRPEPVRVDPRPWIREPFLGRGEEALVLVAGPDCPHCRNLVPRLLDELKESRKFRLAYVTFSPFSPPETELALECARQRRPEIFWEAVRQAYTAPPEELPGWLAERGLDFGKECRGIAKTHELPPVDGVPALITGDGRILGGEREITAYLEE